MLLLMVLMGIIGIVIFHAFPIITYLFGWYTLICTIFFITERIESRK